MRIRLQVANLKRRQAALRRAEQIARAAQFPVCFGHFKAVPCSFQNGELRRSLPFLSGSQQDAIRFMLAAADPATKLMQLRQTESLRVFDQHHTGIRNIHADLEHSRADQRVRFTAPKPFHDLLLLRRRNSAVEQFAAKRMQSFPPQLVLRRSGFHI